MSKTRKKTVIPSAAQRREESCQSPKSAPTKDIEWIFRHAPHRIDEAIRRGVRDALRRHKLLGVPIVIERDGQIVAVPPDEINDDGTVG